MAEYPGAPIVLDFQMDSCPPCQEIAPGFEDLKDQYPGVVFRKVDILQHQAMSMALGIPGVPAFMFWVNDDPEPTAIINAPTIDKLADVEAEIIDIEQKHLDAVAEAEQQAQQSEEVLAQIKKPALAQKFSALF